MSHELQLAVVGMLVAGAAVYVVRAAWKTWFGKASKGCGAGCGKCADSHDGPKPEGRFPLPMS